MTAVYYSSREVWCLHGLSAFTSTSRFTDPDIEEVGEGVYFAHPSTLGLVWVRKKGVGVCPIIVNIGVTCMTYFFSWTRLQIITSISCTNVCHSDYFPYFLNRIHVQCTVYVGILKFLHVPLKVQCKLAHADRCVWQVCPRLCHHCLYFKYVYVKQWL